MATLHGYIIPNLSSGNVVHPYARSASSAIGFGLVTPFRRNHVSDFVSGGGIELVKACVDQVLGMDCSDGVSIGELAWRPELGTLVYKLRHKPNDDVLEHIVRAYVIDAIAKWEPRIMIKSVSVTRASTSSVSDTLRVHVLYDVVSIGKHVLFRDVDQTIVVTT